MLKIICCGQERTSSYCPDCGKKLEHPLAGLFRHLDGVVTVDAAKLETVKKDVAMQKKNPQIHKRRIARIIKTLNKWTQWREVVGAVIGVTEIPVTNESPDIAVEKATGNLATAMDLAALATAGKKGAAAGKKAAAAVAEKNPEPTKEKK